MELFNNSEFTKAKDCNVGVKMVFDSSVCVVSIFRNKEFSMEQPLFFYTSEKPACCIINWLDKFDFPKDFSEQMHKDVDLPKHLHFLPHFNLNFENQEDMDSNAMELTISWDYATHKEQMKKNSFNVFTVIMQTLTVLLEKYVTKTPLSFVTETHKVSYGTVMFESKQANETNTISCHVDTVVHAV